MVVAVVVMGLVQPPVDQEVDVVAMGHRLVAAAWAVGMSVVVAAGRLGVPSGVGVADRDHVLVHVVVVRAMQVAVVQVVDMVLVAHHGVAALRPVDVVVRFVSGMIMGGHGRGVRRRRARASTRD